MQERILRKKIRNLWIFIAMLILSNMYFLMDKFFLSSKEPFAPPNQVYSRPPCTKKKPASGDFLRVVASFKAKDIAIRGFVWDGYDYADERNCFEELEDQLKFNAYVPDNGKPSVRIKPLVRSVVNKNDVEVSYVVYNLRDSIIGRFPTDGSTYKQQIERISQHLVLDTLITLKRP